MENTTDEPGIACCTGFTSASARITGMERSAIRTYWSYAVFTRLEISDVVVSVPVGIATLVPFD
jgi:hypothetical protein